MRLHTLKPRPGSKHRVKRLGSGESSGHGKTSGKGHKGQKARSGGSIRLGFEGGQMPFIRRIPKRGFNNAEFRVNYVVINVSDLNQFDNGTVIDLVLLESKGLANGPFDAFKILGNGALDKKLSVKAHKFSASAKEKIEKAGGTIEVLPLKYQPPTAVAK
ncbi:MAG: 50S ribosomal protein L15 [Verrucomicrobiota bacterium]|nr:50S ribosomal protein L15 [Verrucomicrobiota bacterium]